MQTAGRSLLSLPCSDGLAPLRRTPRGRLRAEFQGTVRGSADTVRVAGRSVEDIWRSVGASEPADRHARAAGRLAHAAERFGGAALPHIQEAVPFTVMLVQDIVADVGTRNAPESASRRSRARTFVFQASLPRISAPELPKNVTDASLTTSRLEDLKSSKCPTRR